ncbi:extracellular solute-binding protein [Pseudalkalibacillus sp. R45]|uniref:extracellular solute-binding protein n=1 Tax=Pseudalkalibacillus sp. R45 TaxID=3457433 RepID=UPI003FCE3F84
MGKLRFKPLLLISLLTLIIALVGCKDEEVSSESKDGKAKEITVALGSGGASYIEGHQDINQDEYVKTTEKMAGVDLKLDVLPHENYEQNLQLLLAGGELPDLLQTKGINTPEIAPAIDAGVLMPLNDLLDKYGKNLKKHIPEESWNSPRVSKDGQIFGIPQENPIRNCCVTYVRQDWLDNMGLEVPKTVDEYVEMLRAFKTEDPNGNGKQDEIPFSARENFAFGHQFFAAYGVHPDAWSYEDGKLIPNFIKPEMKEALEVYQTLYDEKLLDNEFLVQQGKDWDAKILGSGVVGMWAQTSAAPDAIVSKLKANHPDAEVAIIPSPVGPSGEPGGVYPIGSSVSDYIWTIPQDTENPEEVIKFMDWYYEQGNDEADQFFLYGLEEKDHTVEGDEVAYKYPETNEEVGRQFMYQQWIHFTGPKNYLTNEEFIKNKPNGDLIYHSLSVAEKEGVIDEGLEMPAMETLKARPELDYDGLWLEFAAKVITGKESVDNFDTFVSDWKKRGGEDLINEATKWYNDTQK